MAVDSYGYPIHCEWTGGQRNDFVMAESLIKHSHKSYYVFADKRYDSQSISDYASEHGSEVLIPRRKNNTNKNSDMD